jgi:UPF0755 protein
VSPLFRRDKSQERTPEERARARAEREARRRERRGAPAPDLFDVESDFITPPPDLGKGTEPAEAEAPAPEAEARAEDDEAGSEAKEAEPGPPGEDDDAEPRAEDAAGDPRPDHPVDDPDPDAPDAPPDDPVAATRGEQPTVEIPAVELPDRGASFLDQPLREPDHPPRPSLPHSRGPTMLPPPPLGRRLQAAPSRGRKWVLRVFAVLALVLAAAVIWFVVSLVQPFKGAGSTTRVTVMIPVGADAGRIGDILERRGVISSSFFFELRARLAGKRDDLKPGTYSLSKDSSYGDVLGRLSKGPRVVRTVAITIPEGRSRREEAQRIRANSSLRGSYLAATKRSRVLNPRRYGAPAGTPSLEGFLFPATYEVATTGPVKALVNNQLKMFKRAIRHVPMRHARARELTPYEVLIIASMVEREAKLRRERPIVAGVIYNRLKANIPLGIDATIRYATGNWLRPLTQSQLRTHSAYNTRTHQGLPPTPIGSPGLASIRAAAHPKRTSYLYYVVKPGSCGAHAFARTFAQFQRDTARYNAARARRGGRSPAKCRQ